MLFAGAAVAIERVYLLNELDAQTKSLEHTVRFAHRQHKTRENTYISLYQSTHSRGRGSRRQG